MFDYLMAHPEDSKKPEYKELEKIALSAGKKLDVDYSDVEKGNKPSEKYDKWKKAYNLEYSKYERFSCAYRANYCRDR